MPFSVDDTPFGSLSVTLADVDGTLSASIMATAPATLSLAVYGAPPGVPPNGTEGQILVKASDAAWDTEWVDNYATELRIVARNVTGSTLAKGTVVYINGAAGNKPTVTKAIATGDSTSAQTLGMVSADIPNNQNGEVTVRGLLTGLNTSAFAAGTQLYLSGTTAGGVTSTKPSAPVHLVYVGIVSRQHANQGQVEVAIQNGFELHELHDVQIVSPTNGQVLKYDSATGLWKNGTDVGGVAWGGITGTLSAQTDLQNALDAKATAADFLSKAGNLSGLASVSTARTNLGLGTMATQTASNYALLAGATFTGSVIIQNDGDQSVVFRVPSYSNPTQVNQGDIWIDNTDKLYYGVVEYFEGEPNRISYQIARISDLVPYAPLASPALTGNPTATTQATSDNSTRIATTAFVKAQGYLTSAPVTSVAGRTGAVTLSNTDISGLGTMATATATDYLAKAGNLSGLTDLATSRSNLGLGTMAVETASNYLTTSAASSTYAPLASPTFTGTVTIPAGASISGFAPLASPALTGTPTAPTAAAATNTTQIATTAFVQQEVPAASTTAAGKVELATDSEARTGISTTLASTPYRTNLQIINPSALEWATLNSRTSGAGAANIIYGSLVYEQDSPNALTAGYTTLHSNSQMQWVNGGGNTRLTFSKPVWISGKTLKAGGFAGDANNSYRAYVGQTDTGGTPNGGDPAAAAIGIKFTGGASQVFQLMVHDGTTLRTVNGSTTLSTDIVYEWMVYSDGSGNAKMFINGVEEATSSNAPTGTANTAFLVQAINQTASASTRLVLINRNTKVIVGT